MVLFALVNNNCVKPRNVTFVSTHGIAAVCTLKVLYRILFCVIFFVYTAGDHTSKL